MAQRKSLLEEIREQNSGANFNQGVVNSARKTYDDGQQQSQQQGQRTSLLQEIIDRDGMGSLNQDYVNKALGFDGGFGALAGGYIPGEDGQVYMRDYKSEAEILRERMAETAAAKTGTTQQEPTAEPDLEGMSIWDRIKNFFTRDRAKNISEAALTGTGAGYTGAMRTLYEAGQGARSQVNEDLLSQWQRDLERAQADYDYYLEEAGGNVNDPDVVSQRYIIEDLQRKVGAMGTVVNDRVQERATEATTELTRDLEERTAAATERAKAGTGKIGRIAVDATINMLQMGGDALAGIATGGNTLAPMALRVFGQGSSEAQKAGAGIDRQLAFGATAAGIEVFTEKLFDGVAGLYGKGAADEITEAVVGRLARTDAGRTALRLFLGMNEEGLEEVISNVLTPAAQMIYNGQSLGETYRENFNLTDMLYDYLIGAVAAGGMNVVRPVSFYRSNQEANAALRDGGQAQAPATQETAMPTTQSTGEQLVQQVITNMDVSEAEQQILSDGLQAGNADPQTYAQGIQEAFRLGEMGLTYEQAVDNSQLGDRLNETQFRHAWEIGARKAGHSTEAQNLSDTRPVNVPEYESIEEFSRDFKAPEKVTAIFDQVPDVDVNEFAAGFRAAYDMGQSGVSANYLTEANVPTLTAEQAQAAYQLGRQDAEALAVDRDLRTAQKQRTGGNQARVRGSVRGEGVTIAQLRSTFNDRQNTAYRLLTRYADTTGVNIVLYNSQADQSTGLFPAAQGRFQWKDDTIYVDINSGLFSTNDVNGLGNYTMMRTFAHEFTHFIEKWNAAQYNEFREFVFSALEQKGENVHDLIESKMALDESGKMTYEQASREVVADAMMDILPDSSLVQQLADEHPNVFRTLLKKMREFVARMKQYYRGISTKAPREAEALKQNGAYMESIVQMWDNIAKGAVQNYQGANGDILVDQPAKPENLPKRVQEKSKSNPSSVQEQPQVAPQAKRAGMDFFKPVEVTEEEAPDLRQMAAQRNRPATMDFFREVEVTEEEAPDLKSMVPKAEKAPQKAPETQEAEGEPETPAAAETPAQEAQGTSEAAEEAGSAPTVAEVLEEAAESEKPVEPVPPKAETEKAKERLEEINEELGIKTDDVEFGVTAEGEVEESIRRQTGLSNREVLSMAADELDSDSLSEAERNALQIFRDNLTRLEEEQDNRQRLGREYKDQQFTKGGSRQEADRIRAAMSVSDSKIKALENRLLSLENKEVLKGVLEKARRVVELEERKRGDENLKRYRERRNESMATRKYRERVRREVETLREWLMRPSNKDQRAHVPAEIQKTVADFIESINFMSKTALRTSGLETTKADERYLKNLRKMRDAIKANVDTQGYSGYADLPEGFVDTFNALITKAEQHIGDNSGVFVVNQMSAAELQQLAQTIRTLRKYIVTMNSFHNNAMFQHAYEAGEETIEHLKPFEKSKKSGLAYKFLRFDYMRPSYAFEHFGKGGQSIEHEFREGQATQAFLANKIIDFAKKTYTGKEVKKWSKETKTFTTTDGETVTMPITHLMSLYCLNKRPQALTHIYGDGIRVANYKDGKNVQLDEGHIVTLEDVQKMIQELTPRQREVADALQKYMSTETATWGNYVSLARFDVEQFTEENYFPINSDGRYLSTTADESPDNAGLYALLNSSFTKELKENADNRIILYNIFDVFANHTASMTQYRAFALPVLDALKWFNYKNDTTSVRTKLSSAFGAPLDERAGSGAKGYAEQFVINLLKAYNGTSAQGDPYDTLPLKMLHHFNGAAIAYNLRVVIQQPTAVTRAAMILSPAKLLKGLSMSTVQMRKLADEMEQHSGIAAWKALGFYDTNISRGLTDLIKQNPGILDRTMEIGTKGAEMADRFTWAAMWYAAKDSVKRSDYRTEEEYFKAVTDLFEEVIYKTQVVDSLLTKAEFLRSKGGIARQMGSFMSEPSATMSMLTDAYFKYTDDLQQGMGRSEAWKRNGGNIAKTAAVYAVGQVILSAMQAVIDAWRDQDDKDPDWLKNYLQKYLAAFKSNVVEEELIFGKIPLVSELYELMKNYLDKFGVFDKLGLDIYGNDTASGLAMYTKYLTKAVDIIAGKVTGDSKYQNYTNYGIVYNLIRAAANLSGVPFATAWREVQDLWNNTVGFFNPRMKLETYRRKVDQTYIDSIQQTGLAKASYEKILDEADKVHGDGNGSIKQDELGAALVAALEDGTITEDQAQAVWETKGWKKTFDGWRGLGSDAKTETPAASTAGTSTASKRVAFTPTAAPAATSAPATTGARSYDDFKKVPVYDSTAKQAMYGIWETQLQSSMSLDRFMEILTTADTDGNDSLKQDEMGVALMTSLQSGELTFDQCDAIWRTQWNKARSKTFAKWLNG